MMNRVKFDDVCDALALMGESQLKTIMELAEERINDRRDRFETLCANVYDYLQTINDEFPQAHVYLIKSPEEKIDLMDYLIPAETYEICEIGD